MKRFTLWNSYVAITESKEFVDWNKTKIIGSFKCPAFSYRSSTQIKADPFLFEYNNAIYLFYEEKYKNGKGYIVCTWTSTICLLHIKLKTLFIMNYITAMIY